MIENLKKINKYFTTLIISASLPLFLYSCNDDFINEPSKGYEDVRNDKDIETISIPVSISAGIEDQEIRSINLKLVDRENGYQDEYSPRLNSYSSIENISFVLVKASDDRDEFIKTVYTQDVVFNYSTNPDGTKDPRKLYYTGELKFPSGYDFTDGEWYIMGFINYNGGRYINDTKASYLTFGKNTNSSIAHIMGQDDRLNQSSSAVIGAYDGNSINIFSMPYVSQWVKLEVKTRGDGHNLKFAEIKGLRFRPQGVLIQYDFGNNIYSEIDMRRQAVVSNSLSFSGRYDLSGAKVFEAFNLRNQSDGIGIPEWVDDKANMSGYKLYKYKGENPLTIGEPFYPWDTPMPSNSLTPTSSDDWVSANLEEIATDGDAHGVISIPSYKDGTQKWQFRTNTRGRRIMYIWGMPKKIQPQNAYTYFMTSVYDTSIEEDNFSNPIEPRKISNAVIDYESYEKAKKRVDDIDLKIVQYDEKIREYSSIPTTETLENKTQREKNLELYQLYKKSALLNRDVLVANLKSTEDEIAKDGFPPYSKDKKVEYEKILESYYAKLRQEAIQQTTERTQPLIILHQTNHKFSADDNGKVKHIQSLIQTDLMISEVAYKKVSDSEIYSFLEIYNPTTDYIDLSNYAIARLIPNDTNNPTHLSYRKADGTPTDNLEEALILPLSVLDPENTEPFKIGSGWENWRGAKGNYENRSSNLPNFMSDPRAYPKVDRWSSLEYTINSTSIYNGMRRKNYPNKTDFYQWRFKDPNDNKIYISNNQTILLGGHSFIDRARLQKKYINKIDNFENVDIDIRPTDQSFRFAIAYNDGPRDTSNESLGEGTLDLHPGEGFVLIKKNPFNNSSWQVIDASAPIGPKGLGHNIAYSTYKLKFVNKDSFSYRRILNIRYPNIYPFRTNVSNSWEDNINISNQTLGKGNGKEQSSVLTLNWDWKRTPLDSQYNTEYKSRIPKK